MKSKARNWNRK